MSLSTGTTIRRATSPVTQVRGARRSTGIAVTLLVLLAFLGLALLLQSVPDTPDLIFTLGVSLILAICIIRLPITGTYMALVMTILFDGLQSEYIQTFFSTMGVFRNLSYRGLPEGLVISLFELVIVVSMASALIHRFHERKKLVHGPLFWPMIAFAGIISVGEVYGLITGGDFKISLWEIRPLMYLPLMYILAVNTINKPSHWRTLIWLTVVCVAIRCAEGIWRYLQLSPEMRISIPTVLEHDDSVFLVIPYVLFLAAIVWRKWLPRHLLVSLMILIPISLFIMIINHRRAAYLCLVLSIISCLPLIWISLRSRKQRKWLAGLVVAGVIVSGAYLAAFWNSSSSVAAPAQAIRSVFQPNDRDYSSNLYREQENENIRYTIASSPITGIGFGKQMQIIIWMADLTEEWDLQLYMPHNNILWLWMRMGLIGFSIFWIAIGATVLLIVTSVRLGALRLRLLAADRRDLIRALPPGWNTQAVNLSLYGLVVRPRLGANPDDANGEGSARSAAVKTKQLLAANRRDMSECADFLTLSILVLALLASLLATTVVDQGLMSPRLTAYIGLMIGALAAAWNIYGTKLKPAPNLAPQELPEEELGAPVALKRLLPSPAVATAVREA